MQRADVNSIISVTDLTAQIRARLEADFGRVIVEGEISGFKRHSSGHCYFALKDSDARLSCIMYRSDARHLRFSPTDGMQVHAVGKVSVYAPRGEYQLVARGLRPAGEGAIRKAFEAMKSRLAAEGLFDVTAKQPIPELPSAIGIVTSGDGAALRDILNVLERRYPSVRVVLKQTPVQGPGAAEAIARAVEAFNLAAKADTSKRVDVLIVGRGGGSEEDLWAFNEEVVARAIFASQIPIVSAVGHETDVSIADFVADVRAPTPSAAAELVVPDRVSLQRQILKLASRMTVGIRHACRLKRARVTGLVGSHAFNAPVVRIRFLGQRLDELASRADRAIGNRIVHTSLTVGSLEDRLRSLDPKRPLERGFVTVETSDGRITRSAQLSAGDRVTLGFADGQREAEITE
jgi:exodeoxyribonuclease VII large subunit